MFSLLFLLGGFKLPVLCINCIINFHCTKQSDMSISTTFFKCGSGTMKQKEILNRNEAVCKERIEK